MAISFVGWKQAGYDGAAGSTDVSLTNLTGGLASSPSDGDVVFVARGVTRTVDQAFNIRDASDVDYTTITDLYITDINSINLHVGYKRMGATPDTIVRIDNSGHSSYPSIVAIVVLRGCNTATLLDVAARAAAGQDTGQPDPASIFPSTSGAEIVAFGASTASAVFTSSDYDSFTSTAKTESLGNVTIGTGLKTWTSGAFDANQWGGGSTNTTHSWATATFAVRPEPNAYSLTASAASFVLTGAAATLIWGRKIAADAAVFALAGANASLLAARKIVAAAGSFTLTGADAGLLRGLRFAADAASFTLTGASAAFVYGRKIVAEAGSFALTGASAGLIAARRIAADAGAFILTGAAVTFSVVRKLVAGAASFVVTAGTTFLRMPPPYGRTSTGAQQDRDSRSDVQYRTSESEAPEGSRSDVQFRSSASSSQDRSSR